VTAAIATPEGFAPAAKGDPANPESAPVLELIVYADTLLPVW